MSARACAVVTGGAVALPLVLWSLGQFALSTAAGREVADIASRGIDVLLGGEMLMVSAVVPWLIRGTGTLDAAKRIALGLLVPLPVLTFFALAGSTPLVALLAGQFAVVAWTVPVAMTAWLLLIVLQAHRGWSVFCPLLQATFVTIAWRFGDTIIRLPGGP